MGWCHEFGPQITAGCGHPMVAGPGACSCPECEVVCKGRFPGCSAVWDRGPRVVEARRDHVAVRGPRERAEPEPSSSPDAHVEPQQAAPREPAGQEVSLLSAVAPLARTEYHAPAAPRVELVALHPSLEQLRAELRALTGSVERQEALLGELANAVRQPSALTKRILDRITLSPPQGSEEGCRAGDTSGSLRVGPGAPAEAMEDLAVLVKEMVVRLERVEDRLGTLQPGAVAPTFNIQPSGLAERLLPELSADIQSSVTELSDHLEREVQARLAVLQRELASWRSSSQGDNGHGTENTAAVMEELRAATARRDHLEVEANDFLGRVAEQLNRLTEAVVSLRRRLG